MTRTALMLRLRSHLPRPEQTGRAIQLTRTRTALTPGAGDCCTSSLRSLVPKAYAAALMLKLVPSSWDRLRRAQRLTRIAIRSPSSLCGLMLTWRYAADSCSDAETEDRIRLPYCSCKPLQPPSSLPWLFPALGRAQYAVAAPGTPTPEPETGAGDAQALALPGAPTAPLRISEPGGKHG
jgi:hypothetical protein